MKILVTGGAGYIGSHTVVELSRRGHESVIIDNFSNSNVEVLHRLKSITGHTVPCYEGDVRDKSLLMRIFREHAIDAVIHFAGSKAVGESVEQPLKYYQNNIGSSLSLCEAMLEAGLTKLIFSSSATVYGAPEELPLKETSRTGVGITNPYGQTKYMIEQILEDLAAAHPEWTITTLRYFNPIGAHESGTIGEDPADIPNNLMPYIAQVAVGRLEKIHVYGSDYDTPDGTGVRDYIHVVDLAKGHVAALEHMEQSKGLAVYNLGTGRGTSVLELIHAFEQAAGKKLPYELTGRRPGDLASCYADPSKAQIELGWHAEKTIEEACVDSWRWQSNNPHGYAGAKPAASDAHEAA